MRASHRLPNPIIGHLVSIMENRFKSWNRPDPAAMRSYHVREIINVCKIRNKTAHRTASSQVNLLRYNGISLSSATISSLRSECALPASVQLFLSRR